MISLRGTVRRLIPHSLVGQLVVWAVLLALISLPIFQFIFTSSVSRVSREVVDTRLIEFGNQLRGHWTSVQVASEQNNGETVFIPANRFSGGPDADWVWQIAVDGELKERSDFLLLTESSISASPNVSESNFLVVSRETEIGPMRIAERIVSQEQGREHFLVGLRHDRYEDLVAEHAERLEPLALLSALPLSLIVLGLLIFIISAVRRGLARIGTALARYEEGEADQIEGEFASELSQLVEGMNRLLRQNRKLVDRTRKYVSKIAHDINHPLAIMKNGLSKDLIEGDGQELLLRQVDRMTGLVDRYSSLARAIGPDGETISRTSIAELLEDTCLGFSILYRKTPLLIDWQCDEALEFPVPRHDLEAIVSNLLSNAHKYANSMAVITAGRSKTHYWISVADDGPGIPESERQTAVNWGTRLDEAPPGTGFGLSIVRDIVELYDGTVELGSSDLGGLKVSIFLPIGKVL